MAPTKAEEIADAKKSRAGATGWLTRACKACEHLAGLQLKDVDISEYECALKNFNDRLSAWDDAQQKVESLIEEEHLEAEIETAADYREKSEKSKNSLIAAWRKAHRLEDGDANSQGSGRTIQQAIKLPKIDLPKFGGDVLKFTSFWQQFESCVDQQELPDITKFNYLVGLLKGDAKYVLEGLSITQENYAVAKDIIVKRFGRKELIIFSHIQALLSLPVTSNTAELIQFHDKLLANVRALASLDITSDNFWCDFDTNCSV
jgi:hypothetical protein